MFSKDEILGRFSQLNFQQKLAVSLILTYPMYEGYRIFSEKYKFGSHIYLLDLLQRIKLSFDENPELLGLLYIDKEKIEAMTPDSDDFSTEWSTYAQDFSISAYYLAESIISVEDELKHVITHLTETVYCMLYDKYEGKFGLDHKKFLAAINEDEVMQHWLSVINNVILSIASLNAITTEDLESIITRLPKLPYENIKED